MSAFSYSISFPGSVFESFQTHFHDTNQQLIVSLSKTQLKHHLYLTRSGHTILQQQASSQKQLQLQTSLQKKQYLLITGMWPSITSTNNCSPVDTWNRNRWIQPSRPRISAGTLMRDIRSLHSTYACLCSVAGLLIRESIGYQDQSIHFTQINDGVNQYIQSLQADITNKNSLQPIISKIVLAADFIGHLFQDINKTKP